MRYKSLNSGFGIFFDPSKTTSGQRFFGNLCSVLSQDAVPLEQHPKVVLFNISAPWYEVVKAKWRGQKVVMRVDGLYFDRLSPKFINRFGWPLRFFFRIGLIYPKLHDNLAHIANMLDQNYKGFSRIFLADYLIYQSKFSMKLHKIYFPRKPYSIIVNGAKYVGSTYYSKGEDCKQIRLVTIYDEWKPAKRMYELLCFLRWLNKNKQPATLTVLGYSGKVPSGAPKDMKTILERANYITLLPRFIKFDGLHSEALLNADCFITFSYRDPCPNVVVESMAHGLPVLGLASGGMPDIVCNAGKLIQTDDFENGYFSAHRFDSVFPPISYEKVSDALYEVINNLPKYRQRVLRRFSEQLDINLTARDYQKVLVNLIQHKS